MTKNILTKIILSFLIGSSGLLYSSEKMDYHHDNVFLFCLKSDVKPLQISNVGNKIVVDNIELSAFISDNGIVMLEPWVADATPDEHDGDIYSNRIYRAYMSDDRLSNLEYSKESINSLSSVLSSEYENIHKVFYDPNDSQYNSQCSLPAMKADLAWDYWVDAGLIPGDREILLASVDTAVDYTHPDLVDNIWINQGEVPMDIFSEVDTNMDNYISSLEVISFMTINDLDLNFDGVINLRDALINSSPFINNIDDEGDGKTDDLIGWDMVGYSSSPDNDPFPREDVAVNSTWAHGTHVASIMSATTENNLGMAATAFNAKIISIKCSKDNQLESGVYNGYQGIVYAAKAGYFNDTFTIINNSWGGGGYSTYEQSQVNIAYDTYGAIIVAAAGNGLDYPNYGEEYTSHYPSSYENVNSVAAMGCSGTWGHWATYHPTVDFGAPGESILGAVIGVSFEEWDGSSMASPNVSSCFGLLKAYFPDLTNSELETRLEDSADRFIYDINPSYEDCDGNDGDHPGIDCLGNGMVDIFKAIGYDIYPNLEYYSQVLILGDGDGDDVLNPSESAQLRVTLSNEEGWYNATNVVATLSCENPGVTITDDSAIYSSIIFPGGTGNNYADPFEFSLSEDVNLGDIEFTLTVQSDGAEGYIYNKVLHFTVLVSLNQSGFPLETINQVWTSPAVIDLDGDGVTEIIFADYSGFVRIVDNAGNELSSFDTGNQVWGSPAVADINNDGEIEIIVASKSKHLFILDDELDIVLDYDADQYLMGTPALGNIDDDDDLEIMFGGYSGGKYIFAINYDGSDVDGFPYDLGEKVQRGVALADFNNNDKVDIVCGTDSEEIFVILDNATIASGFPYYAGHDIRTAPSVLKYGEELIIFAGSRNDNFYAINGDGSERFVVNTGNDVATSAGFANGNVYFGSNDGFLYGVDLMGNPLDNYPIFLGDAVVASPVFSDLDGDENPEIITATDAGDLFAFGLDGTPYNHFSISFTQPFKSAPTIADTDNDGDLEILIGASGSLVNVDVKQLGTNVDYWNMHRGNLRRTGYFEMAQSSIDNSQIIEDYRLFGAYPNPFNPTTVIGFSIPTFEKQKTVSLQIYDITGRLLVNLIDNQTVKAGYHEITWDASNQPSGLYFVKLVSSNFIDTQKILLIK